MLQNNESRFIPTHPAPEDGVQVGGHGGKGALIISGDKCKKPCASKELKFYEATQAEGPIKMYHDAHLIPQFYGVEQTQVDGETVNYVVMENLTFGFNKYAPTKKGRIKFFVWLSFSLFVGIDVADCCQISDRLSSI